jgi:hypothetical protein
MALLVDVGCTGYINPPSAQRPGAATAGTGPGNGQASNTPVAIQYATVRLTNVQYLNTVHDLLPGVTFADPALPNENVTDNFNNAASGQTPTSELVEDYQNAAEAIAAAVGGSFTALLSCQPTSVADEDTCATGFIKDFGKRAYRRPLTDDESTRFFNFYKSERATDNFQTAITSVIQVFLQSPATIYRLEAGSGSGSGGLIPLTSYEVASRLSYLLTNSMPDATLFQAADQGQLLDPAQIAVQARRLLKDPRARVAVASFNYQWLQFSRMDATTKDAKSFPTFTASIAQALHDSTVRYVDHAFWDLNSLPALLTDTHAYVNDALAPFYGVAAPGSSDMQLVSVDSSRRAGILTQPGLLAGLAGPVDDSPVKRGVLVLDSLLCATPPPPPPGVNTNPPPFDPSVPTTTRERFVTQHAVGGCAACHTPIDAIGFTFENYDAVGAWRTQENGLPVDATSELNGTDIDGPLNGAVMLAGKLAQSKQVAQCVSYHWLRYSLGLDLSQINTAAAHDVADTFWSASGSFQDLLVAIAQSEYFRSVKVSN